MTSIANQTLAGANAAKLERKEAQYLSFPLGSERFAVEILKVQEIRALTVTTPIPNAPVHIRGVINLRGTIVPVVDLRRRFGISTDADSRFAVILVVSVRGRVIGLIADAVPKVLTVGSDDIAAPPELGQRVDLSVVSGVLYRAEELVLILDLECLLATEFDCAEVPLAAVG